VQALQIELNEVNVHFNLANLLATHFQEYQLAREHYEQVLQIMPDDTEAYNNLVVLLVDHFQEYELFSMLFGQ
jgi:Tfp pilus assembly protein PilF